MHRLCLDSRLRGNDTGEEFVQIYQGSISMVMTLVYFSLALIIGIYFGSYLQLPITIALPIIASALLISILWRKNRLVLLAGICIALFLCGALRYGTVSTGDALQPYIGEGTVSITGIVIEEPEPVDSSTKLVLSARDINGQEIAGTLLIRTTRYPLYEYGDLLVITGELEKPPDDLNGFDYSAYLSHQGIYSTLTELGVAFMVLFPFPGFL